MSVSPHASRDQSPGWHWIKFNLVGALGMVVQIIALQILNQGLGIHSSLALAIAVELAVLNNFAWHEKWTWNDRPSHTWRDRLVRLGSFNISNGLVSIVGAILFMEWLHERWHLHVQLVNLISIAVCSLVNFFLSDWLVFRKIENIRQSD